MAERALNATGTQTGARDAIVTGLRHAVATLDALGSRLDLAVLVFITITLPWEFTKTWFPTPILELSRVGTIVAIVLLGLHAVNRSLRVPRGPLRLAIALVIVVQVASFALTRWDMGLKDTVAVGVYAGLGIFTAHVLANRRALLAFAVAVVVSASIIAVVAIAQELGQFYVWQADGNEVLGRRNSTLGDPNVASRFLVIGLIACLALCRARRIPGVVRAGAIAAPALIAIGDALTLSRVGWALAIIAIVIWAGIALSNRRVLVAVAVFAITFGSYLAVAPTLIQRAGTVATDGIARVGVDDPPAISEPSTPVPSGIRASTPLDPVIRALPLDSVRRYLVRAGMAMAIDRPLLGVGVGGFQPKILDEYRHFIPRDRLNNPTTLIHTDAVRIAAETGIVGMAAWLALLGAALATIVGVFRRGRRESRVAAFAAGTALLVILISSQFAGRFYSEPALWLALGVLLVAGDTTHRRSRRHQGDLPAAAPAIGD